MIHRKLSNIHMMGMTHHKVIKNEVRLTVRLPPVTLYHVVQAPTIRGDRKIFGITPTFPPGVHV